MTNFDTNFDFLPADYTPPATGGGYMKLQDGKNKFRILTSPILGWEYWVKNGNQKTPIRLEYTKENYFEAKKQAEKNPDQKDRGVKHFWAMVVWNYEQERVQIFEITQKGLQNGIRAYSQNEDWGNPVGKYDFTIEKTGSGLETEYTLMPSAPKPLNNEIIEEIEKVTVNLRALFYGADPFDENWSEQNTVTDEVFVDDYGNARYEDTLK